ncbi:MAG TPA: PQQ-binding-like beta-propeller repeat protein [Candidatus Acidoferrales bacterium]|nr:PQQ-binding-like beta-propeller repeat protein [Candidatus Acidoferrales bacterium]
MSAGRCLGTVVCALFAACLLAADSWPVYRHDHANSGTASGAATAGQTIASLKKGWVYRAGSRITSTPTVDAGLVFVGTWSGDALAIDASSGKIRWRAHLGANPDEVYGGPRGVIGSIALAGGVAYAASGNCTLAALEEQSGKLHWRVTICDNGKNDDMYASPVVVDGMVLVGVDMLADRPTDRGREIALDAANGRLLWTFEPARYAGEGAGVSATPAVDDARKIVFVGSGNPLPRDNPPPGPDPGSDSIYALDLATGKPRWVYGPVHPHDTNDEDFFGSPNLIVLGGVHPRLVIGEGNKDGTYYAVDATSGAPLWRTQIPGGSPSASIIGTPAVAGDTIFVSIYDGASGSLTALRASDGTVMWQRATGGEYEAPLVAFGEVFTTEIPGRLDAFSPGSGKPLGTWGVCAPAMGRGPSAAGDDLYVASGPCLTQFVRTH